MRFIPWGPDRSFDAEDPFSPDDRPQSVSANGAVARRLYEAPALQKKYVDTMTGILDNAWKEADILKEIDRIQALIAPHLGAGAAGAGVLTDAIRSFVNGRRATILSEIKPTPPVWPYPASNEPCLSTVGTVTGSFSTTFGSLAQQNPFATGTGSFSTEIPPGSPSTAAAVGSAAGYENVPEGRRELFIAGSFPNGKVLALVVLIDPEVFVDGKDMSYDWQSAFGVGLDLSMGQFQTFGLAADGTLHLDKASTNAGAPVTGTFTATMLGSPF
jgi:hypothetical protein